MKTLLLALTMISFSFLHGDVCVPAGAPNYLQNLTLAGPNGNIQFAVAPNAKAIAVWTNFPNQIELQGAYFDGDSWEYLNNCEGSIDAQVSNFVFRDVNNSGTFALGSSPKVGIDKCGNATVVWVSPNGQIIAARYKGPKLTNPLPPPSPPAPRAPQTNFGATQLSDTGTSNISPILAVNPEGITVVVWIRTTSYQVLARSYNPAPGGNWIPNIDFEPVVFMPIQAPISNIDAINSIQCTNIPANSNGTYPAGLGINCSDPNTCFAQGNMVWIDGPTGTVRAGNFVVPFQDTIRSRKVSCGVLDDDRRDLGVDDIHLDKGLSVHN